MHRHVAREGPDFGRRVAPRAVLVPHLLAGPVRARPVSAEGVIAPGRLVDAAGLGPVSDLLLRRAGRVRPGAIERDGIAVGHPVGVQRDIRAVGGIDVPDVDGARLAVVIGLEPGAGVRDRAAGPLLVVVPPPSCRCIEPRRHVPARESMAEPGRLGEREVLVVGGGRRIAGRIIEAGVGDGVRMHRPLRRRRHVRRNVPGRLRRDACRAPVLPPVQPVAAKVVARPLRQFAGRERGVGHAVHVIARRRLGEGQRRRAVPVEGDVDILPLERPLRRHRDVRRDVPDRLRRDARRAPVLLPVRPVAAEVVARPPGQLAFRQPGIGRAVNVIAHGRLGKRRRPAVPVKGDIDIPPLVLPLGRQRDIRAVDRRQSGERRHAADGFERFVVRRHLPAKERAPLARRAGEFHHIRIKGGRRIIPNGRTAGQVVVQPVGDVIEPDKQVLGIGIHVSPGQFPLVVRERDVACAGRHIRPHGIRGRGRTGATPLSHFLPVRRSRNEGLAGILGREAGRRRDDIGQPVRPNGRVVADAITGDNDVLGLRHGGARGGKHQPKNKRS